jgi:hypothetical protein
MKSSTQQSVISTRKWLPTLAATLVLALVTLASVHAHAGVFSLSARPYGQSYGQWGTAWWQWALSIPAATNPLLDSTGEFAGVAQSGPMWFLAGSLGDSKERTITIPAGKAIFMPVHQWIFGATVNDCEPTVPGVTCDVPTLRAAAAAAATGATVLEVSIDGQPVAQVSDYRALSPDSFDVTLPAGNILGLPAGTYGPHVADGYWLMLTPLSVGQHTIVVHAVNPTFSIEYTMIYHITVAQGGSGQ